MARRLEFHSPNATFQVDLRVLAGIPLPPGIGGLIEGSDGTSVLVAPDSIPYEVFLDIHSVPASDVGAPLGDLEFVGAVNVTLQSSVLGGSLVTPAAPLEISIPAPALLPSAEFIVCQQLLLDAPGETPGLQEQCMPIDTASVIGNRIVTNADEIFPGIFGGGLFGLRCEYGIGVRPRGRLRRVGPASGRGGQQQHQPARGDDRWGGAVHAVHQWRAVHRHRFRSVPGIGGNGGRQHPRLGRYRRCRYRIDAAGRPPITRDGIRNGGFERADLSSWATSGAALVRQQLGPTSAGVIIRPTEGNWMADINTGGGSIGGVGSSLLQQFIVPAGVRTLRVDFDFVSEEFPEFVGTQFDDSFRAIITTPSGMSTFAQVSVNQHGGFTLIGNCFFPGGDNTCGRTGWRTGSVDLSAFAGMGMPITVQLLFTANDAGDNIYDTHVLLDNIRFSTLWLDAKAMTGANATLARVQQEVRDATEVLSQAGINVRLRNRLAIADPGGLLDTDATWTTECRPLLLCLIGLGTTKGVPTAEETQLLGLSRSATATDLNVYYVRSLTGLAALAIAMGPDDFHDIEILVNSGVIMTDNVFAETLAHEAGHTLVSPDRAGSVLEHGVGVANNLMNTPRTVPRNVVNRQQSANINRAGAPLLVP